MSDAFTARLSRDQRDAAAHARVDGGMSAPAVARAAKAGTLELRGRTLEPFTISASYVADLGTRLRRERRGKATGIAEEPHRDAIEHLRRRLVVVADEELREEERKRPSKRDLGKLREITRCVREAAALPGPRDPRPAKPGHGPLDERTSSTTRSPNTLAGGILAAHRAAPQNGEGLAVASPSGGDGSGP